MLKESVDKIMKTKYFMVKKILYSMFGESYYHSAKSNIIIFDYLIGRDYDGIYRYLSKILPLDAVVLDVGANTGQYMSRLSKICKNGIIISIEPIAENISALIRMKSFLNIKNAVIVNKAISAEVGTATISTPRLNGIPITTQSTLVNNHDRTIEYDKSDVMTTTLDNIVESFNLLKVDFIKIDTEGHDHAVLNSGKDTITRFRPFLKIETSPISEENKWLFDIGYKQFKLINSQLIPIKNKEDASIFKGDTYLATQERLIKICKELGFSPTIVSKNCE